MDIIVSIPDNNAERVADAYNINSSVFGQEVTADNLAEVLGGHFADEIRRTVQGYEAGQAATAVARAVADTQDPLSTDSKATFATAAADVAEARAARAIDLIETGIAVLDEAEEVKG